VRVRVRVRVRIRIRFRVRNLSIDLQTPFLEVIQEENELGKPSGSVELPTGCPGSLPEVALNPVVSFSVAVTFK